MTVGFFSCSDVERAQGAGRKCIFSIGFLTKCRITWLLHTFLPVILFHLLHTIQSPVLVIWFLTLWSFPGFWQAIHFCELCTWLRWGCVGQENPFRFTFQSPVHLQFPFVLALLLVSNCLGHFPEGKASLQARLAWKLPCFDFNLKSKLHQACAVSTGVLNCYQ